MRYINTILLVIIATISFAQSSRYVKLVVTDFETADEIIGANIVIKETSDILATDLKGEALMYIPDGGANIAISFIGYETMNLFVSGKKDVVRIKIKENFTNLNEVVVSSQRVDENVRGASLGKDVLEIESIRELPPLAGEVDILKSIVLLPGVSTVGEASSGINVRGGGFDQNLILFGDGILYNPSHLFGFFSSIIPEAIDNVTLYKGVVPSRFGGRSSSVLDIKYKTSNYNQWKGTVGIGMGSSKLALTGPIIPGKLAISIGGRASYVNWLIGMFNNDDFAQSSADFYDVSGKVDYALNENNKLSYSFYRSADEFNLASDTTNRWVNQSQVFKWDHYFNDRFSANVILAESLYEFDILNETGINDFTLNSNLSDQSAKLNFDYKLKKSKFNFGGEYKLLEIEPGNFTSDNLDAEDLIISQEQGIESAVYFYNTHEIGEKLEVSYGARYNMYQYIGGKTVNQYADFLPRSTTSVIDQITYGEGEVIQSYNRLAPRFGLRYSVNESTSIKVGVNQMNQFVQLVSNTATPSPVNIWKLSDNYLAPQSVLQYSFGVFKNFKDNTIETSIEAYYKDIDDLVEYRDGAQLLLTENLETELLSGIGEAYGVELYAKKKAGVWTGWASYTYSRSLRRVEGAFFENTVNNGNWYASNFDKPHDFTFVANRKVGRTSKFSTVFTYSTGRPVTYPTAKFRYFGEDIAYFNSRNESRIPDYHRLDVSFTFKVNTNKTWLSGDWTVGIYNIYGRGNAYSVFFDDVPGLAPQAFRLAILNSPVPSLNYSISF